jgi:uncharacterized protein (TIGR00159 family)
MHFIAALYPYFIPALEVMLIASVIYGLLSFFWNTRAMDLMLGVVVFLLLFMLASWLHFPVLATIMQTFVSVAVIAILIIFQPEIRVALAKLSVKGKKYEKLTEFDHFLEALCTSIYRMAEKRIGALVLIENQDSLDEYAAKAVLLNAQFSSELLESIFVGSSPLHDGAVIIRGTTIVAAAAILPLADDTNQITRSMGTRHRAALGITQHTDALSIVVSEESGKVSIARDGIMTRGVKSDSFKGIIRSIFTSATPQGNVKSTIQDFFRTWRGQ